MNQLTQEDIEKLGKEFITELLDEWHREHHAEEHDEVLKADRWVTFEPSGTHVQVDSGGTITAGPAAFAGGKKVSDLKNSQASAAHASAASAHASAAETATTPQNAAGHAQAAAEHAQAAQRPKAQMDATLHPQGKAAMLHMVAGLRQSGLPEETKLKYFNATQKVIKNMPPKAAERAKQGLAGGAHYYGDIESMKSGLKKQYEGNPKAQASIASWRSVGGVYSTGKGGSVYLDGERTGPSRETFASQGQSVLAHETYAHELSHAIDGPKNEHSTSPDWLAIHKAEMSKGQLTDYGADNPKESWAEFGRLLYSGEAGLTQVKATFPKAWAYWESKGYAPEVKGGTPELVSKGALKEIFGRRLELDDEGSHVDEQLENDSEEE